jgi:hypothetical protein
MGEFDTVTVREVLQIAGELGGGGHPRAMHQYGDYVDAARQSYGNFQTNKVVGLVEASCSRRVLRSCPPRTDHSPASLHTWIRCH